MTEEIDPEIIADLRLRAYTERDRSRSGEAVYAPPVFVDRWECRHPQCSTLVDVTPDAVEHLAMFNAELTRRGERLIPTDAIVLCDDHRKLAADYRVGALSKKHDKLRGAIKTIRDSKAPRREAEAIKICQDCHHPDLEGLLQAVESRLSGGKGGKRPSKESV